MNDDYISRKEALSRFSFYQGDRIPEKDIDGFDNTISFKDAKAVIRSISSADVRPVVYAEPVRIFNDPYTGRMFTTCSRCTGKISPKDKFCKHCGADLRGKKESDFCPNCGADMRGKANE